MTRVWCWTTAPLVLLGTCGALLQLGAGAGLVIVAFAASVVGFTAWAQQPEQTTRPTAGTVAVGLLGGIWLLGLIGWVAVAGPAGLAVCTLVVGTGVLAVRAGRRRRQDPPAVSLPESLGETSLPLPHALPELSTADVCWAWRVSYLRVGRPGCPCSEVAFLSDLRAACLDELERRDPVAFSRWLPEARAAGDPARAFCPEARQR